MKSMRNRRHCLNFTSRKKSNMKNKLIITETTSTPSVHFDEKRNCITIKGRAIPINADKFWEPILSWYATNSLSYDGISFNFNFDYINSGSQQFTLKLLRMIAESESRGLVKAGKITWQYEDFDDDMEEMGHDFEFVSGLNFDFEKIESDVLHAA